jgi:Fe-S cluster assembly scaffold protein SufB
MPSTGHLAERARKARAKKAPLGPDIDLSQYASCGAGHSAMDLASFSPAEQALLASAGLDVTEEKRSGTFVQMDHSVVCSRASQEGLEILSTDDALKKFEWLRDYWWNAVPVDADKYTSQVELQWTKGYFLRARPSVRSIFPLQACLYLSQDGIAQNVHNVVIVEEGAELHLITGCAVSPRVKSGLHLGVTEFYVKKGGQLTFTMIHNWSEEVAVRPRSAAIVEEGGLFLSNYICLQPVKSVQMYPTAYLDGANAVARFNSILFATPQSLLDVGARIHLRKPGSRGEIVSRVVTRGGKAWARGHLIGEAPFVKAHMECQGLILDEKGFVHAIPELEGRTKDVEMSHEASVGKIAGEQITYLMARGLSEEEAIATIVRGFLDVKIQGLPPELQRELDQVALAGEKYMF